MNKQSHRKGITREKIRPHIVLFLCLFSFIAGNFFQLIFRFNRSASFGGTEPFESWNPALRAPFSHGNHSLSLTSAINTMRCFTSPGCYPSIHCSGGRPMTLTARRKWEQHSFCTNDIVPDPTSSTGGNAWGRTNDEKCLVYSFGLDKYTEWEVKMAKIFGCDVFAFDPTSNFQKKIAPGVTFHKLGLYGAGANVSITHSSHYDAIDPSLLRTLGEIVRLLGHQGRKIDVPRLDCEGCEYGVLKQLACNGDTQLVKQLMIEFHFQKNLGLSNDADVLVAADAIRCLEEERWGIVTMEKRGCGEDDAEYTDSALKFIKGPFFLLLITMRRVPPTEKESWELFQDVVKAKAQLKVANRKYGTMHGWEQKKWPTDVINDYSSKQENHRLSEEKYHSTFHDRGAVFDEDIGSYPE